MTAVTILASQWDATNRIPEPEAVLVVRCTEGDDVSLTHRYWHLLDQTRCERCGCLADLVHARRHTACPCAAASVRLVTFPQQTPAPAGDHHVARPARTENAHLVAA